MGRIGRIGRLISVVSVLSVPSLLAQVSFEQAARDLSSGDPDTRLRAALLLRDAAYPEAALPLARAIGDAQDDVQLAAIAA